FSRISGRWTPIAPGYSAVLRSSIPAARAANWATVTKFVSVTTTLGMPAFSASTGGATRAGGGGTPPPVAGDQRGTALFPGDLRDLPRDFPLVLRRALPRRGWELGVRDDSDPGEPRPQELAVHGKHEIALEVIVPRLADSLPVERLESWRALALCDHLGPNGTEDFHRL